MGKKALLRRYSLTVVAAFVLMGLFQNCANSSSQENSMQSDPPSTPENYLWLNSEVPSGLRSVNYFTSSKPKDMAGFNGYSFLFNQYLSKKCMVCHRPPSGQLPHFGISTLSYSYDIAKREFRTGDLMMRITANPHCPECNLDQRGEIYQAVMYWLDHR